MVTRLMRALNLRRHLAQRSAGEQSSFSSQKLLLIHLHMTTLLFLVVDFYRKSQAWSSSVSFSDVDEKNDTYVESGDVFTVTRKYNQLEFCGVHRVSYTFEATICS
jgi:hypothetical protein